LQQAEHDHVDDHRPFPTEFVSSETEEGGADTAKEESKGDGGGDVGVGLLVVSGKLDGLNREGVEVESVSGPGEETTDKE
jgi:hypothetical protein